MIVACASLKPRESEEEASMLKLKRNMSTTDRVIRILGGVVLVLVGMFPLNGWNGSVSGMIVSLVAFVPIVTGVVGSCPGYVPFGISTLQKSKTPEA
jgi:hypothetical protein